MAIGGAAAVGGAAAIPFVLGFTATGIAPGSFGAWMMSGAAIANGGGVAAGGVVATMQSVGAAGLGVWAKAGICSTAAAATAAACNAIKCSWAKN